MRFTGRLMLLAVAVPALTLPAAASAGCPTTVCVTPPDARSVLTAVEGGDGSGVLCAYVKLTGAPPHGWSGGSGGAPYVFTQTRKWGDDYPNDWDVQACAPACPTVPTSLETVSCGSVEQVG
ncbi:MAG: hypothetical protein QOE45_2737 [Frankiaceae bacterium]|jgi:hypothetical protein|nr:hypothetical protein [Frankiaceae bacterium]